MDIKQTIEKIARGTTEIINVEGLEKLLKKSAETKQPLKIKAGFDPTAPDIHLGHVVLLRKLRQFQELGHEIYFLIGDFTAQVGDPTGRDQLRPKMDLETIAQNAKTYKKQVFKILNPDKTKVVFNSAWLSKMSVQQIMELTAYSTVAQMLARADFKKRFQDGKEISILEFVYPLLQGFDSVYLEADIELGGSDQKFNLLMGRQLQEAFQQQPQIIIMTPLLEGTDGEKKMSKSLDNYIGINESPKDIFGKVMSISDELMLRYYEVLTSADLAEVKAMHPKEAKLNLAADIVEQFYSAKAAAKEKEEFEKIFSQKKDPEQVPEYKLKKSGEDKIVDIIVSVNFAPSRKEAKRLLQQGAVSLNGQRLAEENDSLEPGMLKVGKRKFLKLC